MNILDIKNIFSFQQYSAQYLADLLKKDKKTIYNYRDNLENIPYGKILLLENLINESKVEEPKTRYKTNIEFELELKIEKLEEEKNILIRTINQLSEYNIELQNKIKK